MARLVIFEEFDQRRQEAMQTVQQIFNASIAMPIVKIANETPIKCVKVLEFEKIFRFGM